MSLPTDYQCYIHKSRYARYEDEQSRRERWIESVKRCINFWRERCPEIGASTYNEIERAVVALEVMPSMRTLMTAGPALDRDNVAGYNCAYTAIDNVRAFDEIMYILMCGTGVGFSVERQYINKLPEVAEEFHPTETTIRVRDSKIGWASAYKELVAMLYAGNVPKWDDSGVRPAGTRLKTFGGRASGPEPLRELYQFTVETFKSAAGRKLNSLEVHDLVCKIAQVIVVGGVRRSALISLSNLTDQRMRNAKSGEWYLTDQQRSLANNSVAYTERPDIGIFMEEWHSLYRSKSGERGIFNRVAAEKQALSSGRREEADFGTNPCSEIILRSKQFCNLTEVVVRSEDSVDDLRRKVRLATILGTLQATLTNFRYLSKRWRDNTEDEALLGVSLTGIMDHELLSGSTDYHLGVLPGTLQSLRKEAIDVNKRYAKKLGINPASAITCVKPSGTVSQLCDSASGIHPRFAKQYIRTVRASRTDPLATFMVQEGFPVEADRTEPNNLVFSFPVSSPEGAVCRDRVSAIQQLELWKLYQEHWCEHKPSITVYVREAEWLRVGAWCYDNFDILSGVAFLPHSDHAYAQAPYQDIDEEGFEEFCKQMPTDIDWDAVEEGDDFTTASQELACVGGSCEI
jgi:ribonucleoside-diphosphate reductase alpha chain